MKKWWDIRREISSIRLISWLALAQRARRSLTVDHKACMISAWAWVSSAQFWRFACDDKSGNYWRVCAYLLPPKIFLDELKNQLIPLTKAFPFSYFRLHHQNGARIGIQHQAELIDRRKILSIFFPHRSLSLTRSSYHKVKSTGIEASCTNKRRQQTDDLI